MTAAARFGSEPAAASGLQPQPGGADSGTFVGQHQQRAAREVARGRRQEPSGRASNLL